MIDLHRALGVHALPHVDGGDDVEDTEFGEPPRMVEREAIRDSRAAIVSDEAETGVAELVDDAQHVLRHLALGIGIVALVRARRGGPAVAAQIHRDDAMRFRQRWRNLVPHHMRLRETMQQHDGLAILRAADTGENRAFLGGDIPALEAGEEIGEIAHISLRFSDEPDPWHQYPDDRSLPASQFSPRQHKPARALPADPRQWRRR